LLFLFRKRVTIHQELGDFVRFMVQLRAFDDDGELIADDTILSLDKGSDRLEDLGLSLSESKDILAGLQRPMVEAQLAAYVDRHRCCERCGRSLLIKGSYQLLFRTLFGALSLTSPRFHRCCCQPGESKTFSPLAALLTEHASPELLYLETKWASLVSYGVTVDLLKDVLPIDRANISTVRRDLNKIAARAEAELDRELPCSGQGVPDVRQDEADPVVVGIDGGYVRNWYAKKRRFGVVVGKSIVKDQNDRYFGLVQTHDHQPKRRVAKVLREQGLSMTEEMTFLTDGADNVRNLALDMSPSAKHFLDWFHLTMRLTVLGRYTEGLRHHDPKQADELACRIDGIKWCLWHGKTDEALHRIRLLADDLTKIETAYPYMKRFVRKTDELHTYVTNNQSSITDYGKRWRQSKRIATSFVESTVNVLIGKRFAKSQQMQWSKQGAHHLLQTRARTLDETLHTMFQKWYPGMAANDQNISNLNVAA